MIVISFPTLTSIIELIKTFVSPFKTVIVALVEFSSGYDVRLNSAVYIDTEGFRFIRLNNNL